jgi:DNA-binding response OmpR family regulator
MNCLLIDDDLDDQEIFTLALREVNPDLQCMLAKDGREGLEKIRLLKGEIHDFIFIDLNMPRMNGIETLEEINKISFSKRPRIIIYSTNSDQSSKDGALKKGADEFLVKPTSLRTLVQQLKELFNRYPAKH